MLTRRLAGLGDLTEGQLTQARRQFRQRVSDPLQAAVDRLNAAQTSGSIPEPIYHQLIDQAASLAERISAHLNDLQYLSMDVSLLNWEVTSDQIAQRASALVTDIDMALAPVAPGELQPSVLVTGQRTRAGAGWPFIVAGVGVVGLIGLFAFNIARSR